MKELERRGLVERRWNPDDFRAYVLQLTERGKQMLACVEQLARIHSEQICEGLDGNERKQLASLLSFIAVRLASFKPCRVCGDLAGNDMLDAK